MMPIDRCLIRHRILLVPSGVTLDLPPVLEYPAILESMTSATSLYLIMMLYIGSMMGGDMAL